MNLQLNSLSICCNREPLRIWQEQGKQQSMYLLRAEQQPNINYIAILECTNYPVC